MKTEKSNLTLITMVLGFLLFHIPWLLWVATGIAAIAVVSPYLGGLISNGWLWLGVALGRITGPLILGLVFFVVLFPVALLFRLLGKDNLMIKNKYTTTFIPVNKGYAKDDFEKVW
jgi:hypothetical protein